MAAAAKPARQVPAHKPWNTLRTLRAALWTLLALDVLLLLACIASARIERDAIQTIGRDTAPGIIAAQKIRLALADMDSTSATDLMSASPVATTSRNGYEATRIAAAKALIDAAQNIRYGREQRDPIERIQQMLGEYDARVQRALDLHDEKSPAMLAAWNDATNLMDTNLAPAAEALDAVNTRHLDAAYRSQVSFSIAARIVVLVFGVMLLITLLSTQTFLADRTRRILNLPLFAATLAGVGFTIWSLTIAGTEGRDLKVAGRDAFVSIHALWNARATAVAAVDDEDRLLLNRGRQPRDAEDFDRNAALLMTIPPGVAISRIAENGLNPHGPTAFTGYFADELNNITFPGEREAAVQTILNFGEFLRISHEVRRLELAAKQAEALALWTGKRPGEAGYAYTEFIQSLDRTIDINQRAFDAAVSDGFGALANFEAEATAASALIALLIVAGLMQRISEYR